MLQAIPKYNPEVQSGITLAVCILENIAHSACAMPESTPCEVGEDDPWSPLSFPNMATFRDFVSNAMWQQYQSGQYVLEYPEEGQEDDELDGDTFETMIEGHDGGRVPSTTVSDSERTETNVLFEEQGHEGGHGPSTTNVPHDDEPRSPPATFKVFIERVFDLPPSQPPEAYVVTPSPSGTHSEEALPRPVASE